MPNFGADGAQSGLGGLMKEGSNSTDQCSKTSSVMSTTGADSVYFGEKAAALGFRAKRVLGLKVHELMVKRYADIHTYIQTDRQTDRHTDIQTINGPIIPLLHFTISQLEAVDFISILPPGPFHVQYFL